MQIKNYGILTIHWSTFFKAFVLIEYFEINRNAEQTFEVILMTTSIAFIRKCSLTWSRTNKERKTYHRFIRKQHKIYIKKKVFAMISYR